MGHTVVGRRCLAAATAAVTVLALSGCGGFSAANGGSGHLDPALKTAQCLRAHGVPNFPDPTAGGPLVIPNGINANAPAFQSAQRTCDKLLPAGGSGAKPSESARLAMLAMARCIRTHGVPNFPDPTATPPTVAAQRAAQALGRGGLFLIISDPDAPAFKHAAAACHFQLPHPPSG